MNEINTGKVARQKAYRDKTKAKLENYERIVNLIRSCEMRELEEKEKRKNGTIK